MSKSRGCKRKPAPNRTATRKPTSDVVAGPRPAPSRLSGSSAQRRYSEIFGSVLMGATPELLPVVLPAFKWLFSVEDAGMPGIGNRCIDAAFALQPAYEQLGIRAHVVPVQLTVHDQQSGRTWVHGEANPRWGNDLWSGHCILYLPGADGRFIDVTAEQYEEIARLKVGPVIGRTAGMIGQLEPGAVPPAGSQFTVQRQNLMLAYIVAPDGSLEHLRARPDMEMPWEAYRRCGTNLAAHTVSALRHPEVVDRALQAPYPRVRALLDVIGDVAEDADTGEDWRFELPGPDGRTQWVRLDQIPLPPAASVLV